jgi:sugar/nucleoside kinase (ribokinase family)
MTGMQSDKSYEMDKRKLLFVGLNTIDLQFLVNRFPKSNTKTKALKNEICVGGPATNAAIACAFLGSETILVSPVGKHEFSGFIKNEISTCGLQFMDPIEGKDTEPVFASIITSAVNGDRTVFSYHPEINSINIDKLKFKYNNYKLALFDGFYAEMALPLASEFRKRDIVTVFDGGSWKEGTEQILKYMDIAICSNDFQVPEGEKAEDVFACLHSLGVKDAAITRGGDSILCSHKAGQEEIGIERIDAIDTLGAGDIFHGAFCHFFAGGHSFTNSLQRASIIAGESCRWFGTREWMRNFSTKE